MLSVIQTLLTELHVDYRVNMRDLSQSIRSFKYMYVKLLLLLVMAAIVELQKNYLPQVCCMENLCPKGSQGLKRESPDLKSFSYIHTVHTCCVQLTEHS